MKSLKKYLILILMIGVMFNTCIYASTNTYTRTEDDLKINSTIKVTESVKKAALATPKVDASEKVYDFAGLLTDSEESELYNKIITFINTYNMDMAVVTINENNKSSAMEYADDFYDYNDFGKGTTFDGVIFLIDMDNREMWISTTGQAIIMYDDYRIDKILDETYNYISSKKYYKCAEAFVQKASTFASYGKPSSNSNYKVDENGDYVKTNSKNTFPILGIIVFSLVASSIFILIASLRHKTIKKATQAKHYLVRNSFKLTKKEDRFVNTHTTKVYDPPSSSSGGGSSSHSSSSGRSHGGGGRSF
jgi:uncharacterized protein